MGITSHPMAALVGQLIGDRYRILKEQGSGQLDWIYQATDRQHNDRFVTLKVLQPVYASQEHQRLRFLRQAQRQESLWHPGVVQVQAIQETEAYVFVAMEWIEGETLGEMAQRFGTHFSIDGVIQLLHPAGAVLEYAHGTQVVHGEVNPDAIAIDWSQEFLQVKVTDFSLPLEPGARQHGAITAAMQRNVAYISPEQAADSGPVDLRSDIYSLGACMYLLATGQAPFAGDYHQVLQQIPHGPKHPSEVTPSCPPVLSDVILKCMARSPDARFGSVQELLDALTELRPFAANREFIEIVGLNPPPKARRTPPEEPKAPGTPRAARPAGGSPPQRAPVARQALRDPGPPKLLWSIAVVALVALVGVVLWFFLLRDDGRCKEGTTRACYTGPAATRGKGICQEGQQICKDGVFGQCQDQVPPAAKEICNGKDDDCDGKIDNSPAFADLGKACKAREGACMTPGNYACTDDGQGLRCKVSRKAKEGEQLNLLLVPEKQTITLYWRGKPHKAKGLFCLPRPSRRRISLVLLRRGYHTCRLRLRRKSWSKGTLTLELKRRIPGAPRPRRAYCLP